MQPALPLVTVIVPAAGVGKRMQSSIPKQYLQIDGKTVLEHTVERLLQCQYIEKVIVAVNQTDPYFAELSIAKHLKVTRVNGGKERADSVLSALDYLVDNDNNLNDLASVQWVMVHDAARPCVNLEDIERLVSNAIKHPVGAILATPVRDTMKRTDVNKSIHQTVERENLWHALTPQMFPLKELRSNLKSALKQNKAVTDEASVFEMNDKQPLIVQGSADNLKITQPEDLALAEFYLSRIKQNTHGA